LTYEFEGAFFHVISKDQGFVSLVDHLNQSSTNARLMDALLHLNTGGVAFAVPVDLADRVDHARNWLKARAVSRPASRKTLLSSLEKSAFHKSIDADEAEEVLAQLIARKLVKLNGEKVSYMGAINE